MPRDRAVVLDAIRREWGSEAAFASFVRTQLLKLLAVSKRRYSQQIAIVATRAFVPDGLWRMSDARPARGRGREKAKGRSPQEQNGLTSAERAPQDTCGEPQTALHGKPLISL